MAENKALKIHKTRIILNLEKVEYTIILTDHVYTAREKETKTRMHGFTKNTIKAVVNYALKNTDLIERQFEKTVIVFPTDLETDKYAGFLVAVEGNNIVMVSIYENTSDKYVKVGIFNKVRKVFLNDFNPNNIYDPHATPKVKKEIKTYIPKYTGKLRIVKKAHEGKLRIVKKASKKKTD